MLSKHWEAGPPSGHWSQVKTKTQDSEAMAGPSSLSKGQSLNMDLGELATQLLHPHGSRPIPGTKETRGPSLQDVIGFGGVGSN